ncbi:MAG: zf-HC2 domain-containing protein [Spirochaetes bacterium]|nr:zf-HC2 domain-containing protein [Spirochaetota bacterium]
MKRCRYNRPDFIAAYYDGVLPEEERTSFEAHLFTCAECMDALLSLEKDSFLMRSMREYYEAAPAYRPAKSVALFELVKNGIRLVRNLAEPPVFEHMLPVPARGRTDASSGWYRISRGDITVSLREGEGERFDLEVSGIRGKSALLYRFGKLVEAHALSKRDTVVFYRLAKGSYRLAAAQGGKPCDEYLLEFTVR